MLLLLQEGFHLD